MEKINLDISPKFKTVEVNNKILKIPKLGLRHRLLIKEGMDHEESLAAIVSSVSPNLSFAERDLSTVHILAYNDRIKSSKIIDGFEYNVDNIYICQKLKFCYGDFEFKFKSPSMKTLKGPVDLLLKECCIYVKRKGEKIDIPDFMDLPPFVYSWIEQITHTIAIDGPNGTSIKGIYDIVELFDE